MLAEATVHFGALPHRLQPISDPAGQLTFINDSLSTTPQSAIAALEAFAGRSITVILGGTDRGLDYTPLATHLAHASASVRVITVPDSGPRISSAAHRAWLGNHRRRRPHLGCCGSSHSDPRRWGGAALPRGP